MAEPRGHRSAFGKPGIEPKWTQGNKDGVGTAYSGSSRLWFTIFRGVVTEVFYPTIDRPQLRDIQYMISDGATFVHEEKRHLTTWIERSDPHALSFRIVNSEENGRYRLTKDVIADPHLPCLLQRTVLEAGEDLRQSLRVYVLCAPHLQVGGWGNNARIVEVGGRSILTAEKGGIWLAVGATAPFARASCGYVAESDGATDLNQHKRLEWEFDEALDGNVALTGELDLSGGWEFTTGAAFGDSLSSAITSLFQSLATPFHQHMERYVEQWRRPCKHIMPLDAVSSDGGGLYHGSYSLLLSHEDKTYPGAFIASLSIPWGEAKGDTDQGGYHVVWTRDLVNTATGLLAAGNKVTPLRALIYLAASQLPDGRFPQNFWIDGTPYWGGIQLDEVAFPILLAWRLRHENALLDFDPFVMVRRAACYLVRNGPATKQERWEDSSGYSPSTLAACIAALICAACFCREQGDSATAQFLTEYADFLESHIEAWMVTSTGTLLPEVRRHWIRLLPADIDDPCPAEDPDSAVATIPNQPPGEVLRLPAKEIVDAGFLELVRYGVRRPDDPLIVDSLRVIDAVLKVDTPSGPCWRRYNHDGYGQRDDGGPFVGWGTGRAWPLLTGERAHYEFAAGRDVGPFVRTIEQFATCTGLLTEQVWDAPDRPEMHMCLGKPTTAAMPLMWAHAEYVKLLRSIQDGRVFDFIPEVAERFCNGTRRRNLEIWKPNRRVGSVQPGWTLRIQAPADFRLHWTDDEWQSANDGDSKSVAVGSHFVDIPILPEQRAPIRFTFLWNEDARWDGNDYQVTVEAR
ncbi:MAG: glucan 1,4-alpha-glucosidase [Proteobacteria bacterium]|nr:MAG: glucan 1,4-alpha-glucosidase [Pseudomonadota bacterium]